MAAKTYKCKSLAKGGGGRFARQSDTLAGIAQAINAIAEALVTLDRKGR